MKNPNSGLFSFGKGLGDALLLKNTDQFNLSYYVHHRSMYVFGNKVRLVYLSKLHKLLLPAYKRFNLVHFTDQYCRLKPNKVRAKKVLTIHDLNPVHEKLRSARRLKKYINRLGRYINACDKIVAISQFVAADIVQHFPQARNKITVIYNGSDQLKVTKGHLPAIKPTAEFLFTIGFVAAKKNFHVLPALLKNNKLQLIIAGVLTPYTETIIQEAVKYNCADRVIITGPVSDDDRAWYYDNCRAFVFPSLAEGFGLPVIEAMHFGKPVFLSTSTSLPEIGSDKAYYFQNFDADEMNTVFTNGIRDFETRQRSAEMQEYASRFTWENTAQQYLQLYTDVLS